MLGYFIKRSMHDSIVKAYLLVQKVAKKHALRANICQYHAGFFYLYWDISPRRAAFSIMIRLNNIINVRINFMDVDLVQEAPTCPQTPTWG